MTPLFWASRWCYSEVVELLAPGIDVNQAEKNRETLLFWASRSSRAEVVKPLLAAPGIEVFKKDKEGKSALDIALDRAVASLVDEVVDVKLTYRALLLALMHHGTSRAVAPDVAMHGLPSEHARAMAKRMRDTWPASP